MTKLTFMVAALVAASAYASEASAARSPATSRHGTARHGTARHAQVTTAADNACDCVRAPSVGAYASDPYTQPPCMPNTAN